LVKNFGNILDYNFTKKVEQILMKLPKEMSTDDGIYKFHPNKDVEANAERERRRILGKDPKTGKQVSVRLEVWTYGSNWKLMKRKFASLI
jgi:DNA topoisomerase-1